MNRYRTMPGLAPVKAAVTTTCQKCLKKDNYECKSTAQERPYISRPSRTQQLLNPRLKPRLTADTANDLMKKEGVADEELARVRATRASVEKENSRQSNRQSPSSARQRSNSVSSSDSVATISTSKSKSPDPKRSNDHRESKYGEERHRSRSHSASPSRKRKLRDLSPSSVSRSPPQFNSPSKFRRYGNGSPEVRGRSRDDRRRRRRSRSTEDSVDRSEVTKHRKLLDESNKADSFPKESIQDRNLSGQNSNRGRQNRPSIRERSLSPYSRRLALTQAMNMGR